MYRYQNLYKLTVLLLFNCTYAEHHTTEQKKQDKLLSSNKFEAKNERENQIFGSVASILGNFCKTLIHRKDKDKVQEYVTELVNDVVQTAQLITRKPANQKQLVQIYLQYILYHCWQCTRENI